MTPIALNKEKKNETDHNTEQSSSGILIELEWMILSKHFQVGFRVEF